MESNNSKNVTIGVLVVIVVLVLGMWWYNSTQNPAVTTPTTVNVTPVTPTPTSPTFTSAAPTVATLTQALDVSNSTALVSGTINPRGAITTFWYQYGKDTTMTQNTTHQIVGSGYTTLTAPGNITGLAANTTYYFRLVANNKFGTVSGDMSSFTTNNTPPVPGTIPVSTTQSASNITRDSVVLNGQVNPNNSATNYWFEYGTSADLGSTFTIRSAGSGNNPVSVSATLSGLQPLTKYYFRVNSQNQFGVAIGSTQNFTTLGPVTPTAPIVRTTSASNIDSDSAVFHGTINPNDSSTTYYFQYSRNSDMSSVIGTLPSSPTSDQPLTGTGTKSVTISVANLNSNTDYYYRLVGVNQYGTVMGNVMSFTTRR